MKGEDRFRQSLRRIFAKPELAGMPKPDDSWGAWVEYRLQRLEGQQTWIMRIILSALVMQVGLHVLGMLS